MGITSEILKPCMNYPNFSGLQSYSYQMITHTYEFGLKLNLVSYKFEEFKTNMTPFHCYKISPISPGRVALKIYDATPYIECQVHPTNLS